MKKIILIICLLVLSAIVMFACKGVPQAKATDSKPSAASGNQVVAYYFHGTFRCSSCLKIEQYSREAIEKYFGNELKSGNLVFKVINVEGKGNEHYMNDYQLYTKSLVLSLVKDGKEIKSVNLKQVWEYLGNREKFYEYVKNNVDSYLGNCRNDRTASCAGIGIVAGHTYFDKPLSSCHKHSRGFISFKEDSSSLYGVYFRCCLYVRQDGRLCGAWLDNYQLSLKRSAGSTVPAEIYGQGFRSSACNHRAFFIGINHYKIARHITL